MIKNSNRAYSFLTKQGSRCERCHLISNHPDKELNEQRNETTESKKSNNNRTNIFLDQKNEEKKRKTKKEKNQKHGSRTAKQDAQLVERK